MDWGEGAISRSAAALAVALLAVLALASSASAVQVRLPDGQLLGVTPHAGVAPASIPGARRSTASPNVADNGNVVYQGGPVVRSSAPYLIYWDPASAITTATKTLITRYLTDVSHDSGLASNVYGVLRQYSDRTGIADYQQTFSAGQATVDSRAYPAMDTTNCVDSAPSDEATCLTDTQLRAELTRFIAANALPTDGPTSASELPANAPIYFIVTPANVNICFQASQCTDNFFCAYHSSYVDGANNVLYSPIPLLTALVTDPGNGLNPKNCQFDNNAAVQEPNGNGADVALKYLSHEDSETITDPLGSGWYDPTSGNEVGDNCNFWNGTAANVALGDEPNAFEPTLGGMATSGTLFDQVINTAHHYYTQSEWSNGDVDCEMQPATSTLLPSFTVPSGPAVSGSSVGLDPAATSSTGGYSSIAWSFGDGATRFTSTATASNPMPTPVSHTYTGPGVYTVTLTVVDTHGNLAAVSHTVTVDSPPSASFSASATHPPVGSSVSFDATGSSDPNLGASITAYQWSFGDGTTATGATASHAYPSAGVRTVTLSVTDSLGFTASVTKGIQAVTTPTAAFTFSPAPAVPGHAVAFSAAGSSDPNAGGQLTSYSWSFGDGTSATGATASHTYRAPGVYAAAVTVRDGFGLSASATHLVLVNAPGRPRSRSVALSGVGKGKPKLSFELLAGVDAPGLKKVTVALPSGLRFAAKGLAGAVSAKGAGGRKLTFTAALSHGKLTVSLKTPAAAVKLALTPPALIASSKLERKVRSGKVKSLSVTLTALDSAGTSTLLGITPKV
jgi:PKD repeat protein